MKRLQPQSLTAQFALVVACLAALVLAVGATALYSLTYSANAVRGLTQAKLEPGEDAQALVQRTLTVERMALQLSSDRTVDALRQTHRHILEQLEVLDRLVDRFTSAAAGNDVGVDVLALHRSSQRFRNTVNIEAQMRATMLASTGLPGAGTQADAPMAGLDEEVQRQADALSAAARQVADDFTLDYRKRIENLAQNSESLRAWVVGEVAVSLLLTWLIVRVFLGRHIVARLRLVSHYLRHGHREGAGESDGAQTRVPVGAADEIADMARAVEQFLEDRRERARAEDALKRLNAELETRVAQRTAELAAALAGQTAEMAERQRAEEAARASAHFLDSIIENIPVILFVKEAVSLRFLHVNRATEELLGYGREELIGKSVHDLFPVQQAEFFAQMDRAVLEARRLVDIPEETVQTRDGPRLVHTMKIPIVDASGKPQFLIGISRDITEHKRAEAASQESERRYREAQIALAHANRVTTIGQLATSMSHEIKQPVAAIITNVHAGLIWLHAASPNLQKVEQAFARILKDAERTAEILDRIHGLVGKSPPSTERLQINEVIGEVIGLMRAQVAASGVSVRMHLADELPIIEGDRIGLQQVMLNLVVNAVEAMSGLDDQRRELIVDTGSDESGDVIVRVRDRGRGLAADSINRIFQPFYTSKAGGMGMGLSICQSIIEAHGGRLWASANAPRGAVFQFALPGARGREANRSSDAPPT
ncbi:ATP-binding protein [Paraburkholderia sp. CNPSo 3272]|uniref:PAS domain-containing sensor histidine kinase n=1 Tax=Paraburkholderia sp. CNPSo 3272 TaxID=2940931 RepID=UPI0020B90242|nr:PAS domain-containing sensor histidine kinase [Paraburkholderia sp. CNPSo 3272]MCP3727762.1 ATP-binding protein [Paraburkholderia sp. CNPSo 3272]